MIIFVYDVYVCMYVYVYMCIFARACIYLYIWTSLAYLRFGNPCRFSHGWYEDVHDAHDILEAHHAYQTWIDVAQYGMRWFSAS